MNARGFGLGEVEGRRSGLEGRRFVVIVYMMMMMYLPR